MTKEIEEKLAASLTAETSDLLPFLPYLLQDFWELGSDPNALVKLIQTHADVSKHTKVLDLACGKGAVSVRIAQKLGAQVKGVDLIPAFTEFAVQKAAEHNVSDLCEFVVADINEAVEAARDYDIVILAAVGDALGSPAETLRKLRKTVKTGGYILIDECYLPDDGSQDDVRYKNYDYLTEAEWHVLFADAGFELIETVLASDLDSPENHDSETGMVAITTRAQELMEKYPDQKEMFEGYIRSQQNEYDDMDSGVEGVVWVLKKIH